MKKKIIIASLALLLTLSVGYGVSYLLSLHKITFTLENGTSAITVYTSSDKKLKQLASGDHILLQEGDYYVIPEGENLATDKIKFTVENHDETITINPPYTKEYLDEALEKEKPAIEAAITDKYPSLMPGYTVEQGSLYKKGDWFGGLLVPRAASYREQGDPYRIVLHKENDEWKVIRRPEYVLTSSRYEEVPIDVLREINAIVQ